MKKEIDLDQVATRILMRAIRNDEPISVFLIGDSIRTVRDFDVNFDSIVRRYGDKFIGRYDKNCPHEWLYDDLVYASKIWQLSASR